MDSLSQFRKSLAEYRFFSLSLPKSCTSLSLSRPGSRRVHTCQLHHHSSFRACCKAHSWHNSDLQMQPPDGPFSMKSLSHHSSYDNSGHSRPFLYQAQQGASQSYLVLINLRPIKPTRTYLMSLQKFQ